MRTKNHLGYLAKKNDRQKETEKILKLRERREWLEKVNYLKMLELESRKWPS